MSLPWLKRRISLFELTAYLVILAVAVPLLWTYFSTNHPDRWVALGLLIAFTALTVLRDQLSPERDSPLAFLYMGIQTLLIVVLSLLDPQFFGPVILFFMLSPEAMFMFSPRIAYAWLGLFTLATAAIIWMTLGAENLLILPIYVAGYVFFALFARQTNEANAARQESQRLLEELRSAHRQLQQYAAQAEELAVAQERNRLAREMHDTLGHRLTVSAVQLQAVERLMTSDPERAMRMVATARDQVRDALAELRRTVATLRAPVEADLALEPALKRLAGGFEQATGISVHLSLPEVLPSLSAPQRLALYRGAQEGLTNIQKHAQASQAWLSLEQQNGQLSLVVSDDGMGLEDGATGQDGFGLRGLQERAAQLGGQVYLEPRAGGGTQLSMMVPLVTGEEDLA